MKKKIIFSIAFIVALFGCKKENPVEQHDEQFIQIDYSYNFKDELNTFEGFLQKDLVMDGTTKVSFWLSTQEQNSILEAVNEAHFFALPDTIYSQKDVTIAPNPSPDGLRIKYEGQEKTVTWFYPLEPGSESTLLLNNLTSKIREVINSSSTYQKLPPARGGYQ